MGMREFQKRMEKLTALENPEAAKVADVVSHSQQEVIDIALKNDVEKIRSLPSLADRAEYKRNHFFPKWLPLVDEYFAKGEIYQNDVIAYCIIYSFDVGDLGSATRLARMAIAQNQAMPANFRSTLPTFVADQVLAWAERMAHQGQSVEPYFSDTFEAVATAWKLHEIVTAKWYKFAATLFLRNAQGEVHAASVADIESLEMALFLAQKANEYNHKAGVNSMIDRIIMRLKKLHQSADLNLDIRHLTVEDAIEKLRSRTSLATPALADKEQADV
ncbi:phage terminase small subunit [Avibacterium paragallinarum]|uniref:phage terminase small subunit n=2 Tax=Avibacterium paragallinarum TaxID=728 RepID=UPI00061522A8|nr:phage terminase small subunit [Avibacterium paragallinarum]KAA6209310.1 terminase [Avibacterium paragallinarum]KKB01557.1 terminase [Avibacterium paragallinarum]RZN72235.1 terminase [Avibacterium paragallinarum]